MTNSSLCMINGRRMTVREVAEALGYQPDTIQGKVKELFPELVRNGVTTLLTMAEVDTIKQNLVPRNLGLKSEVENALTPIDIERMTLQVIQYHAGRVKELEAELAVALPKAELADRIASADGLKSLSEVGKINGIGPGKIFDILVSLKVIYRTGKSWVPYQDYIDRGLFVVRESTYEADGIDHLYSKTYVTGKGELWLARRLYAEVGA